MAVKNLKLPADKQAFDAIEVHPCKVIERVEIGTSGKFCDTIEQCEPEEAEFWSVYVHFVGGGLDCIADCDTKGEADCLAELVERIATNFVKA